MYTQLDHINDNHYTGQLIHSNNSDAIKQIGNHYKVLHPATNVQLYSLVNQTLSPVWRLLIGDYKHPLQKGLEHFHYIVCSTNVQIL